MKETPKPDADNVSGGVTGECIPLPGNPLPEIYPMPLPGPIYPDPILPGTYDIK